jgi:hypothetical protein
MATNLVGFNVLRDSIYERLLSESSRSYMLAYYLSVCIATVQIF